MSNRDTTDFTGEDVFSSFFGYDESGRDEHGNQMGGIGLPTNIETAILNKSLDTITLEKYVTAMTVEMAKSLPEVPELTGGVKQAGTVRPTLQDGVLEWPGFSPSRLKQLVKKHIAPQLIIGMRVADVLRYSRISTHIWKPGWRIELKDANKTPTNEDKRLIREAEQFILRGTIEEGNIREREYHNLKNFDTMLAALVRNTLTYDGIAIWTDTDTEGKVKTFAPLDAGCIRLTDPDTGYKGNKRIFAVAYGDNQRVEETFTRYQLVWYTRNPRLDPDVYGYGLSEIEIAEKLVLGYSDAMEMNLDIFKKNTIPPGILVLKGGFTQKVLNVMQRLWTNMKKGVSKSWIMPVMRAPADGSIEFVDLSRIKGQDAFFREWINMLVGALCLTYQFPVHRFGYHISGTSRGDEKPDQPPEWIDQDDPGLLVLLQHLETVINNYILSTRYPSLQFVFSGKSPREDAREYDARRLAMTVDDRRSAADFPTWEESLPKGATEEEKQVARLFGMAPVDPGLTSLYATIVSTLLKTSVEQEKVEGAPFNSTQDPVASEHHGHTSGTRRDSAREKGKVQ